jgi:hypothetical protein
MVQSMVQVAGLGSSALEVRLGDSSGLGSVWSEAVVGVGGGGGSVGDCGWVMGGWVARAVMVLVLVEACC